jgi:hypothetical protein
MQHPESQHDKARLQNDARHQPDDASPGPAELYRIRQARQLVEQALGNVGQPLSGGDPINDGPDPTAGATSAEVVDCDGAPVDRVRLTCATCGRPHEIVIAVSRHGGES